MKPLYTSEELCEYADTILLLKKRRKSDFLAKLAIGMLKINAVYGTKQYTALEKHLNKIDPKGTLKFKK